MKSKYRCATQPKLEWKPSTNQRFGFSIKIFQITTVKVTNEGRLTENTLTQGDGSFYDYCMEIEPDIRKQCIDILVNKILPSGMFELTGEDTLLYKGGAEQWKKEFVAYIQAKASELTTENVQDWI